MPRSWRPLSITILSSFNRLNPSYNEAAIVVTMTHSNPENCIFSSRDTSAEATMKKSTNGHRFDVVLNISSGDYLQTVSWPLGAPFGRFVELRRSTDLATEGSV